MKKIRYFLKLLLVIFLHNPFKIVYFNFKMLPFRQAVRLPIVFYSKVVFRSLQGNIKIDGVIRPNMIRIGDKKWHPGTMSPTILKIDGTIIFHGDMPIGMSNYILVAKDGLLDFGTHGTTLGSNNKIICFDKISIGNNCRITWENQIIDTSFHYIECDNVIEPLNSPIIIGDNCWIGNRTTISKGTVLPDYSIVASGSVVNKDFSNCGEFCFYAGIPAKLKKTNIKRIFDVNEEKKLDEKYHYNRTKL